VGIGRDVEERPQQTQPEEPEREVNPAEGPGPRGNQEVDEERLERDLEDLERAGAN
jgi:hypothetical protein